jgi:soluble lytic murein transglycosylase
VPLALAAYNIGPGNLHRFLQSRPDMKNLEDGHSDPDDEIWVDELPWSETSGYVKAVMRNLLVYEWLEKNEMVLPKPLWAQPEGTDR